MMRAISVLVMILCVPVLASAEIGPAKTKRERQLKSPEAGDSFSHRRSGSAADQLYRDIKNAFLNQDYQTAEKLSAQYLAIQPAPPRAEDVCYFRAMALLQLGRRMESRSQFRLLEDLSANVESKAAASASVGDTYFFEGDTRTARDRYLETLAKYPHSAQTGYLNTRLSEIGLKPASRALGQMEMEERGLYGVQVGSFSNRNNAQALAGKLTAQSYAAFVQKDPKKKIYRVRIGKFENRQEAKSLEAQLQKDGYPTKIYS